MPPLEIEPERAGKTQAGDRLAGFSIRYPVTICMVFLSFIVLGLVSLTKIPLVLTPDINFPFIGIMVPYPNATPGQVQESIAKPLEEAVSTVPHVQRLITRSSDEETFIGMTFDWGQDVDWLRSEVREKVDQIRRDLPEDVDQIFVRNWSTNDNPIVDGQISSGRDLRNAYDFIDLKIKKPLERLAGVAEVEIWGAQRKEIEIYLRLDDVKRHRVDVSRLFRRLDNSNLNLSLGRVVDGGMRYGTVTEGAMNSLDAIRNFPVNDRGIRLGDIARIEVDNPVANSGRHLNGQFAIGFAVRKNSQANTVDTVRRVMNRIEELNQDPSLKGIQVLVWFDAGEEITRSLSGLLDSGTIGALLAVIVLFFFLRKLGATLAIGFAIPFSIIATVGFLFLLGKTLNVLSMMGLMLATGMLVDNAVVVLESIFQNLEKGKDRVTAARVGTQEVITAVTAATLTSIIIFVPLVFGRQTSYSVWLADTGTSIIIALLCSLFISLTLIPLGVGKWIRIDVSKKSKWQLWIENHVVPHTQALSARISRHRKMSAGIETLELASRQQPQVPGCQAGTGLERSPSESGGFGPSEFGGSVRHKRVADRYLLMVDWCLRHRFVCGLLLVPVMVGVSAFVLKKVPDNSPEAQDLQNLSIQYEFSENYHYAKIEQVYVNSVEKFLLANKERFKIKNVNSFYQNNEANTLVYFDKERMTLEQLMQIREQISKELPVIPGAEINLGGQEGAEAQTFIGLNLYGEDSATLQTLAREARNRLRRTGKFTEIHNDLDRGREEVQIRLNRELARKYNVSPESVSRVLGIVVRGQRLRGFRTSEGEVDIWVRLQASDRENLEDLKSMVVGTGPNGEEILLMQVAQLDLVKTPGVIQREDRRTSTWMFANYRGEKKDEGKNLVTEVMNGLEYPSGYGWNFGFWTQRQEKEDREFYFNLLLALFMVYFVMASLFESLVHPFAIMTSLPFALVGVAWTLYLTGTPLNLMAMIGLMVLLGIVVNNGIVMLDHVNNLRRHGMPRREAILQGCRERFRPILMTACTTVVGLLPLAIGTSGVFNFRYFPLARTVMGGLIASTVLTLIVLPTYYTLFDDFAIWLKRIWLASNPAGVKQPMEPTLVEPSSETVGG
jgi:hydrophobic/amphiphilic exporter-1 (mainly G- bacteria), HAE1 family